MIVIGLTVRRDILPVFWLLDDQRARSSLS